MILVIGPRLEGHSVIIIAIQTHPSCRFHLAVDSLGPRWRGSWSQFIERQQVHAVVADCQVLAVVDPDAPSDDALCRRRRPANPCSIINTYG